MNDPAECTVPVLLTIVLLCSGKGADTQSYRPNLDESQWWGRRDALVRCVAASLFGPRGGIRNDRSAPDAPSINTELVLLFDEDGAAIRLVSPKLGRSEDKCTIGVPTERNVVSAFRSAAKGAGRSQSSSSKRSISDFTFLGHALPPGIKCIKEPWKLAMSRKPCQSSNDYGRKAESPSAGDISFDLSGLQSKREVLMHIQSRCPLSFLRKNRLNSGPDVILRKTNREKLAKIWELWIGEGGSGPKVVMTGEKRQGAESSSNASGNNADNGRTELTFRSILLDLLGESPRLDDQAISSPSKNGAPRVMAGILHEDFGSELPCFFSRSEPMKADSSSLRLCLFLGAVRDMTTSENDALKRACSGLKIPLLGFRLGPVPEFTSKILGVVSYHNARGVLGPAALRLWRQTLPNSAKDDESATKRGGGSRCTQCIHFISAVPMQSKALAPDLDQRSRLVWALVRVCVSALWRSKLVSTTDLPGATSIENILTLIFEDRLVVTIKQVDLVTSMAEKHQAAPSEHQILNALCKKRDEATNEKQFDLKAVVKSAAFPLQSKQICCCLNITFGQGAYRQSEKALVDHVYSDEDNSSPDVSVGGLVFVHIPLRKGLNVTPPRMNDVLYSVFLQANIPVLQQAVVIPDDVQDAEAATVVMLQHFAYQSRLFPCLQSLCPGNPDNSSDNTKLTKKRRRKEKEKDKRKDKVQTKNTI